MNTQNCPICQAEVTPSERYPNYVCEDCTKRAVNSEGIPVKFSNIDGGGGFVAITEKYNGVVKTNNHLCFIDKVACYADEAKFGGIVIIPKDK